MEQQFETIKKLIWWGLISVSGWSGIVMISVGRSVYGYYSEDYFEYLRASDLGFIYFISWTLLIVGTIRCLYLLYIKKRWDELDVSSKED